MVWKMVPHITSHALFEMTTVCLNTSFESCSPLVNAPPRSARTHAMSQPAAVANRLFYISLVSAVTFLRWSGQIYSQLVSSFLRSLCTKNYWNHLIFDSYFKNKNGDVFWDTVYIFLCSGTCISATLASCVLFLCCLNLLFLSLAEQTNNDDDCTKKKLLKTYNAKSLEN